MRLDWPARAAIYGIEQQPTADERQFWSTLGSGADSILVAPGGVGVLAEALAGAGRRLVLVDREAEMVRRASALLEGLPGSCTAHRADLRSLAMADRFDLVCVPRAALMLFGGEDRARALRSLAALLAPGGVLVLELLRLRGEPPESPLAFYDPALPDGTWVCDWARPLSDGRWLERRRRQDHGEGSLTLSFRYAFGSTPEQARREGPLGHAQVRLHALSAAALLDLSRGSGLTSLWERDGYRASGNGRSAHRLIGLARCR